MFALKVINNPYNVQGELHADVLGELRALQALSQSTSYHAHVVRIYDFWIERGNSPRLFIKMELCESNLEDFLSGLCHTNKEIDPLDLLEIMIQISSGLQFCHNNNVLHRDLKTSNGNYPVGLKHNK